VVQDVAPVKDERGLGHAADSSVAQHMAGHMLKSTACNQAA
jgi:hypothetical protein